MRVLPRSAVCLVAIVGFAVVAFGVHAQEQEEPTEGPFLPVQLDEEYEPAKPEPEEGPPLPLHTIEGTGGLVLTPTAYLVNPGFDLSLGKPSVSAQAVWVGHKDMQNLAATWTLWERVELGYAVNRLGLDDFPRDVRAATGLDIDTNDVYLHHLNARVNLVREGEWDMSWMPAVTAGVHYKYNADIYEIDRDLGGVLSAVGYNDNDGVDMTLTATKSVACMGRPTIVSAGLRASKAAQFGLTGFGDDYLVSFEGSVVMLVTDQLAIGTEVRQKRDQYADVPGLVEGEDTWWDVHAAYILNNNAEIYAVVGDAGAVLNERDETFWGVVFKYEF